MFTTHQLHKLLNASTSFRMHYTQSKTSILRVENEQFILTDPTSIQSRRTTRLYERTKGNAHDKRRETNS